MSLIYLNEENSIYIEDYQYKPLEGKHTLIIRNNNDFPVYVNVNRQVKSLSINKVYNYEIDNNSSYEFDFPIDDTIPPNILSLFIDNQNITYDNKTDMLNVPYIVPEGNDDINPVTYYIDIEDKLTKRKLVENFEYVPDFNSIDGITEIWYKFDNSELKLPNYRSGKLEKVNESKIGALLFENNFKYGEVYLHLFARDSEGNVSEENIILIDIEVPSFVTDGYKINDVELYEGIELNSFNSNTMFDFSQVKTSRDLDVYYDIQLMSINVKDKTEKKIGKSFENVLYPGEVDLEFTPIDIDNTLYEYYVDIRTKNRYGRTLGFKRSPKFSFKIKQSFNIEYIDVLDSPIVAFDADGSTSINSRNKTLVIGYSGYSTRDMNNQIDIEFRSRDSRDKKIPATKWKNLKSQYLTNSTGEMQINFDTAILDPNGFKLYDIRVSKNYDEYQSIIKTNYNLLGDSHVVNDEQTSNYFTAVKIPTEVLANKTVKVQEKIQGEIFESEMIKVDNNLTCRGFSKTSAYFIATSRFSPDISMSNYDDMTLMRNEIRSVINNNNFKEDVSIIRPYDETMESYVVFERGNVELNADFWNKKYSVPTDSPFIRQYKDMETSISTMIGNEIDKKVVLKDDYRLYRKNNLPKPNISTNIEPELIKTDNGEKGLVFSNPISIVSYNNYGLETNIEYEYETEDLETPTDLFTDYQQGSLLEDSGHYSFKLRSFINYGLETFYSEPTLYQFDLIYQNRTFREPVFRELVDTDGKIILTVETNVNDGKYHYYFKNNNTGEDITYKFIKYDEDTDNVKFKWKIQDYGIYNINLTYSNELFEDEINTVVIYNEGKTDTQTEGGVLKYHKSTDTKLSNRYNNAYLETNAEDTKDKFYVADLNENGNEDRILIATGYTIPFYYPTVINLLEASVDQNHRNHIHDPINPSSASENPLITQGKEHSVSERKSYNVDSVDSNLTPDKPIISLFSEKPIEGKFNNRPSENDDNYVMESVDINVVNGDANWETEIIINGEKFKDTNITYDRSGEHKIIAIFRDRFNYTMNYATAKINIKKSYLYSPIDIDLKSVKNEFTEEKDKFNLLDFGKEFTENDLNKFDNLTNTPLKIMKSGKYGNFLLGVNDITTSTLIDLKLNSTFKIKPSTTYIYSVEIALPNNEFNQDQYQPVHYHWFDDTAQGARKTLEFLGFEKIDDLFYRVSFKVETVDKFKTDDPYFRFFLFNSSNYIPENAEFYIRNISLIESDKPNENYLGNRKYYSSNDLTEKNSSITSDAYLVLIKYFFITQEILNQRNISDVEPEENLCKKKEYRIDTGNWISYNDDTQIIINKPCVVEARKVMKDETIIRDSIEFTPEMFGYNLPIPPVFLGSEYNNKEEGYSYFPVIEKNMGHTYRLELNGKPLEFGTPILSNGALRDYEKFEITAYSKHYKYPDREAQTTITFKAKNRPPEKPYLKGIKNKEINHINDKDFRVEISDFEDGVNYLIKVNDRILNHGDKLFEENNYKLNGTFIITVIAKNDLGLTSYNSYYIDNNRNIADDYHELDYQRNSLILNSRDKKNYEFNNEMIMDLRTGDISYTDNDGYLVDVTAGLKEKLNVIESSLNNINVNSIITRGNISLILDELSYINKNNDFLEKTLKEAIDKLENIQKTVENSNTLKNDLIEMQQKINDNMSLVNTLSKSVKSKTNMINQNIGKIQKEIIDTLPVQRENISLVAKSYYNLESVNIESKKKVSKKEFNAFKKKYEKFLKDLQTYIKNF